MKPSLLPCDCDDGTCEECKNISELNNAIKKTSVVYRNELGEITMILPTGTVMAYKRIMKGK